MTVLQSRLYDFTCERIWDGVRYFSFQLRWSIPAYWALTDVLDEFDLEITSGENRNGFIREVVQVLASLELLVDAFNQTQGFIALDRKIVWHIKH